MSAGDQNWLRRFRSASCSSDLDVDENSMKTESKMGFPERRCGGTRARAFTADTACKQQEFYMERFAASLALGHEMLISQPSVFPFASLTEDCKLRIFSELTPAQRGVAARVCHEWSVLMRKPILWNVIDFASFPPYPSTTEDNALTAGERLLAYDNYRARVKDYLAFLVNIHPEMSFLRFEFDIGDVRDGWLDALQALLHASQLQNFEHAELGWTETPAKPYVPDNSSATWCATDCKDLMYRHRHRQRLFVKFFDTFTAVASSIVSLTLPFDWTERSLRALHRLPNIEILNLQKYFVFQAIDQTLINNLFNSVPLLRCLTMEIWTPSGRGLQKFRFCSDKLELLDVSSVVGCTLRNCHYLKWLNFVLVCVP